MAEGLAPVSYLRRLSASLTKLKTLNLNPTSSIGLKHGGRVKALHNYDAAAIGDGFHFLKDDILEVVSIVDANWITTRRAFEGKITQGLTPINYITPIGVNTDL